MFDRVDTGYYLSGGTMAVGGTAEVLGNAKEDTATQVCEVITKVTDKAVEAVANKDIMDIDVLFGLIPGWELHISGFIIMLGALGMIKNYFDGKKRKKERIESSIN